MTQNGSATRFCSGNNPAPFETIAVIGGGAWGTALALIANAAGRRVSLWIREPEALAAIAADRRNPFLPDHPLPDGIRATGDLASALGGADLALLVVPSQFLRQKAREVERLLPRGVPVVIGSKGIEATTGALMTQVVTEEMPRRPWAVLSGPSFADEAAAGQPTAVSIASEDVGGTGAMPGSLAARVAVTLGTAAFRPYLSDDPIGVEVSGAVKNVLAIACGIAAGRGFGSNPRAALITRGLAEIQRLTQALGGKSETATGLAGIGDLALTCSSEQSRNFSFGKSLGRGDLPIGTPAGSPPVVEGAVNARSVTALARRLRVEMPICEAVDAIIHDDLPIGEAIQHLLTRPLRAESLDLEHARLPHPARTQGRRELLPA